MKHVFAVLGALLMTGLLLSGCAEQKDPSDNQSLTAPGPVLVKNDCVTIQDGILTYSATHYLAGQPITTGFDDYGYNYQAHMFNGLYANAYLGGYGYPPYTGDDESYLNENPGAAGTWVWPYRHVELSMKWNDAWIANTDCDGNGSLDRHYGLPNYIDSGAWLTNHMSGVDEGEHWTYFTKIVAAPAEAYVSGGIWYLPEGTEIGPVIWGEFATIQEVESGAGATYISPARAGLGNW